MKSEVSGERIYDYPLNGVNTTGSGDGTVGINGFIFDKCISNSGSCVGTVYTNDNINKRISINEISNIY